MWVGGWVDELVQQVHNPYSLVVGGMLRNHRHGAAKKDNKLNNIHSSKTNYTIHFFEKREREREREGLDGEPIW